MPGWYPQILRMAVGDVGDPERVKIPFFHLRKSASSADSHPGPEPEYPQMAQMNADGGTGKPWTPEVSERVKIPLFHLRKSASWACFEKADGKRRAFGLIVLGFEVNGRKATQGAMGALAVIEYFDVIEDS